LNYIRDFPKRSRASAKIVTFARIARRLNLTGIRAEEALQFRCSLQRATWRKAWLTVIRRKFQSGSFATLRTALNSRGGWASSWSAWWAKWSAAAAARRLKGDFNARIIRVRIRRILICASVSRSSYIVFFSAGNVNVWI